MRFTWIVADKQFKIRSTDIFWAYFEKIYAVCTIIKHGSLCTLNQAVSLTLSSPVVVVWLRVAVVRFDHREGHDVIAASTDTTNSPEPVQSTIANELLVVHGVVCIVLELKLLLLLHWHRCLLLATVALPCVLLLRLQSLFVSTSTWRLPTFSLFVCIFLRFFIFSAINVLWLVRLPTKVKLVSLTDHRGSTGCCFEASRFPYP